jgi:hypothetical protein
VLPGFYHDTLGERDRAAAGGQARDFILRRLRATPPLAVAAPGAPPGGPTTRRVRWPRRCRRCRPRGLYWAATRRPEAADRRCPRASGWARHRLRLRQHAGLRLSQPGARRRAAGPADRPQLSRRDRLARHPPAQAACRRTAAPGDGRAARRAGRCAWSTSPPDMAATCWRPSAQARQVRCARSDPAARLQRNQRARRPRADHRQSGLGDDRRFEQADAFDPTAWRHARRRTRRRWAWCRACTNCSPTTSMVSALAGRPGRGHARGGYWSTPASPGIRSSS